MNIQHLHKVAITVSCISAGVATYTAYATTQPKPILDIDYKYDKEYGLESALVLINSTIPIPTLLPPFDADTSPKCLLKDAKGKHINLGCLEDKGYDVHPLEDRALGEPVIYIKNAANRVSFSDDCKACRVATEIEYSTLFGRRKEVLEWAPQASHQLIRVLPRPTHTEQTSLPKKLS